VSICSAQEGSPKNEGCLHILLHIKYYKIYRNEKVSYFLPEYSRRFLQGSRPIGRLDANTSMLVWALSSWGCRRPFWAWHWHLLQDRIVHFQSFGFWSNNQ
jgi:hypothetical protein